MSLRHRAMQPKDFPECVELVASHPVVGPGYGDQIYNLGRAWLRILDREAKSAVVFEELEGVRARILGIGVTLFVHDCFVRELKTPPLFWFGKEITMRILRGDTLLLSDKELREANSRGGLNLVTWEGCFRPVDSSRPDVFIKVASAFMEDHGGFQWKEMIAA